jgi:hypothetical protein
MDSGESLKAAEVIASFNEHCTNSSISPTPNDKTQAGSVVKSKVQHKPRQIENMGYKQLKTRLLNTKESVKLRNLSATFYRQQNAGKLSVMGDTKDIKEDKFIAAKLSRALHAGDLLNELIVID